MLPLMVSGWITAFLFWNTDSKPYGRTTTKRLELNGMQFPYLDTDELPVGYASTPFTILKLRGTKDISCVYSRWDAGQADQQGRSWGF